VNKRYISLEGSSMMGMENLRLLYRGRKKSRKR